MQTLFVLFWVVGPHDGCGRASVKVYEVRSNAYSVEAIHLQCFTDKGYAIKSISHCDISRDTLAVVACTGFFLTCFDRVSRIPIGRRDNKREPASGSQLIKVTNELMVHAIEVRMCAIKLFESEENEAHFFFFPAFDSAIATACFSG
jgi:hypothetical protein